MKKLFFIGVLSIVSSQLECVVAVGDASVPNVTFGFSIGSAIYNAESMQIWTASGQDLSSFNPSIQKYGISYTPFVSPDNSSGTATLTAYPNLTTEAIVTALTPTLVVLPSAANPLIGQAYTALTLVGTAPTVVCESDLATIYLIESVSFSSESSVVNKISYTASSEIAAIGGIGSTNLFAAYAPGTFGIFGSTLSFVHLTTQQYVTITTNNQGETVSTSTNYACLQEQASLPITINTSVLTAGTADLDSIGSSIAMYTSGVANRMYIGLDVSSDIGAGDCGVGLFTATGVNSTGETPGTLTFSSVLPDDVVTNSGDITTVVSVQDTDQVAIRNITTTTTSTGLGYLFVSRDNGTNITGGEQSIYAMPMVTMPGTNVDFGKIAAFDSIQKNYTIAGSTKGFNTIIADASEIDINSIDAAVAARLLVGGAPVPAVAGQYISQMIAQGDSVYIVIPEQFATGTTPGVFTSQSLFDETGRIMAWTPWQRVVGSDQQILFAMNDRISGSTMFVSAPVSAVTPVFNTVQQTTWNSNADLAAYSAKVTSALPKNNGGVQGNFPFPTTTSGFTGAGSEVSMLVTTGNGSVLVAQTGALDATTSTFQILPQTNDTSIVIDSTLGLSIGSVVAAAFGNDGGGNWLFMGGDQGLAVLSADNGTGFAALPNTGAALYLTPAGQTCKTLGNFKFVKKIISDGNYLFVMTQDAVYQILLLETKFTASNPAALEAVQVVAATQLAPFAYCLDMLMCNGTILLGTTAGLFSIDITAGVPGVVTSIPVPLGLPSISKIQLLSNRTSGFNVDILSNLYVLSIDYSTLQARLNRFTMSQYNADPIVITPIQDQLIKDQNGPLRIFDTMSNSMFIDGSLGYMTAYKMGIQPASIKYLQYTLRSGTSGSQIKTNNSISNIAIKPLAQALNIAGIARDFSSGCLMLAGDIGLLTLS